MAVKLSSCHRPINLFLFWLDETTYPNTAMQTPIRKVSKDLPEAPPVQKYVRRSVPQTQSASNRTETASCSK